MDGINTDKEHNSSATLTHEEILKLIEEIKRFENKFLVFSSECEDLKEFTEVGLGAQTNERKIIEVKHDFSDNKIKLSSVEDKPKILRLKDTIKKISKLKIKSKSSSETKRKEFTPTTFKIRINDNGKLVNLDIKKTKPKSQSKRSFNFNKFKIFKSKSKEGTDENKPFVSKLKGVFNKIGKLKKVIPFKGKSED